MKALYTSCCQSTPVPYLVHTSYNVCRSSKSPSSNGGFAEGSVAGSEDSGFGSVFSASVAHTTHSSPKGHQSDSEDALPPHGSREDGDSMNSLRALGLNGSESEPSARPLASGPAPPHSGHLPPDASTAPPLPEGQRGDSEAATHGTLLTESRSRPLTFQRTLSSRCVCEGVHMGRTTKMTGSHHMTERLIMYIPS